MKKAKRTNLFLITLAMLALAPALSHAQSTGNAAQVQLANGQTDQTTVGVPQGFGGIFSCNQNGSYAMSVGSLGATGGVYVPVADAAVELNTGTLVYKECILREVIDAERQAATAGFAQQTTNQVLTGRNGAAEFVQNQGQELTQVGTAAIQQFLQNGLNSLDPTIKSQVQQAIAQTYANQTLNATAGLACPYQGATSDFTNANPSGNIWNDILAIASPCNPLFAYINANDMGNSYVAEEQNCLLNEWQWGGGFYAVTTGSGGPCEQQIVTPSSEVNSLYTQVLQSPFYQLENANDLGQMVGALFAGISTQVLNGQGGGIPGLTQSVGNQPSYLQQAIQQTTQNLQTQVSNAALANLQSALQIEQSYHDLMSQLADSLTSAISQLRSNENECWQQVIAHVCSGTVSANGTCIAASSCTDTTGVQVNASGSDGSSNTNTTTCSQGQTLHVATSTKFSQAVINSQITSYASTTINNIQVSDQALSLINQLIQNVSGTSADSQAVAVAQLNSLISNHELHSQADLTTTEQQVKAVQATLQTLTTNVPQLWAGTDPNNADSTNLPWNGSVGATLDASSPGVGWCNFENQTTLQEWVQQWL